MGHLGIEMTNDIWKISENSFNDNYLGKYEVIMAQGNGYMGLRSATEECYINEKRNFFIGGTFNKAHESEVTELPNLPDVIQIHMTLNGEKFDLNHGTVHFYERSLNLKTGELKRKIQWETEATGIVDMEFSRIVSMKDKNLIVQKVVIYPRDKSINLVILSGIDGQMTNSGAQHFIEGTKRLYEQRMMHMNQKTNHSDIDVLINCIHKSRINGEEIEDKLLIRMDRRRIFGKMEMNVEKENTYVLNKYSMVATSRDLVYKDFSYEDMHHDLLKKLTKTQQKSYEELLKESSTTWDEKVWSKVELSIRSKDMINQIAPKFAQYHLQIMVPEHDTRMGMGAKGYTGEGYKGHSFWDTEIFMFPYFLYSQPQLARQLLEYRYNTLQGARQKAKDNGYKGAMFPWESAWLTDSEVTPIWGAADIITGEATKIWSGFIEQHITADIAYAIWQYYMVTRDEVFMETCGYEILFETANFWASRCEKNPKMDTYHINQVVGPDEYKEHVDDNAFTNYLVKLNFDLAIKYAVKLKENNSELFETLDSYINISDALVEWEDKANKLYLPQMNNDLILPQDASYLSKKNIDLTKYKTQNHVGLLFDDYNLDQVNDIQVSKQADVLMLFYLRENLFSKEVKQANWDYYEARTLHDSSLSLSTHAIIANDLGNFELAYELFQKCRDIDLGENMKSSDAGIHAASLGGMLQVIMNGFGGVRVLEGKLRIEPCLPKNWEELILNMNWHQDILRITIRQDEVIVENTTHKNQIIEFTHKECKYLLSEKITIDLKNPIA